jgi:hypothetical protein
MAAASKDYEAARAEQVRLQKEARRLERLAAILPDVAARELAQQQLAELTGVPLLPPSAPSERVAAVTKRSEALVAERTATHRLQQHQAELAAIQINDAVLADAEAIEAIHHATTPIAKRASIPPGPLLAIEAAQSDFDFVLRQIAGDEKPADPLQWIPDPTRTAKIRALITAGATLKATHQANLKTRREKKLEIDQLDAAILSLGQANGAEDLAPSSIRLPITAIRKRERNSSKTKRLASGSETGQPKPVDLKMPSAEAMARTTVPLDAELQLFKSEDEELRRRARSIREAIEKIEDDLAALQGDIKGLEVRGDVPTREAVVGERATRNALWLGIRRHFMPTPGEAVPADRPPPAERYERAVNAPMTQPTACSPMPNEPPVTPSFACANRRCRTPSPWKGNAKRRSPGHRKISIGAGPHCSRRTACRPERSPKPRPGPPGGRPSCRSSMPVRRSGWRRSSAASLPGKSVPGSAKSMA